MPMSMQSDVAQPTGRTESQHSQLLALTDHSALASKALGQVDGLKAAGGELYGTWSPAVVQGPVGWR
jgi:hypothetical protein